MEEKQIKPRGTDKARIIFLIETQSLKGTGTKEDPARIVYQYWDLNGNLIFEKD